MSRRRVGVGLGILGVLGVARWLGADASAPDGRVAAEAVREPASPEAPPRAVPRPEASARIAAARPAPAPLAAEADEEIEAPDEPSAAPMPQEEVLAILQAGEEAMDEGDLATATASFATIVEQAPDSSMAPFAAYKLAWCEWNAGRLQEAIVEMERALVWTEAGPAAAAQSLVPQIRADLERFRTEAGG